MLSNNFYRKPGKRIIILKHGADKYVAVERFGDLTRLIFPYFRWFIFVTHLVTIANSIITSKKIKMKIVCNVIQNGLSESILSILMSPLYSFTCHSNSLQLNETCFYFLVVNSNSRRNVQLFIRRIINIFMLSFIARAIYVYYTKVITNRHFVLL